METVPDWYTMSSCTISRERRRSPPVAFVGLRDRTFNGCYVYYRQTSSRRLRTEDLEMWDSEILMDSFRAIADES